MRIAYICCDPGVPVFGTKGASVHVQEVVRALRHEGHDVVVHTARRGDLVPHDLLDLEVVESPVPACSAPQRETAQARAAELTAQRVLAEGADLVYERYSLFSTALSTVTASCGAVGVLEVNAPLIDEQRLHRVLVDERRALSCLRAQVSGAHLTVCVSDPVRCWVEEQVPGSRPMTVPNGVDPHRITPSAEDPSQVVVVFVGTLKPWHGVSDLITAASLARGRWRLRVVGDGPQMPALRSQAERLRVDVDFTGAVPPDAIASHLAGAAIAVAPYPDLGPAEQYFSPLKVLEYLAAGLPVVASRVGQLPQLLDGAGVLVPPSDPPALAAALDTLAQSPAERARLGAVARRHAVDRHSWQSAVRTILRASGATA